MKHCVLRETLKNRLHTFLVLNLLHLLNLMLIIFYYNYWAIAKTIFALRHHVTIRQDKEIGPLFKASEAFMNMFWLLEEAFLHSLPNKITTMLSSLYAYWPVWKGGTNLKCIALPHGKRAEGKKHETYKHSFLKSWRWIDLLSIH